MTRFLVEIDEGELNDMRDSSDALDNSLSPAEILAEVINNQPGDYPGGPKTYNALVVEVKE